MPLKTYLLNDKESGEYKIKEKNNKPNVLKYTYENKKNKLKMAQSNNKPPTQNKVLFENKQIIYKLPVIQNKQIINKPPIQNKPIIQRPKNSKILEKQRFLFSQICKIIGISGNPIGQAISFDKLNDPSTIKDLFAIQEALKDAFPSSKLTSLHSNAIDKQSFPGVNIVRQIFKEMGLKLKPHNYSEGYLGKKKLLRREYNIIPI